MDAIQINGARISFEQLGSGPDVLLLSGLGDSHRAWENQLSALSDRYRITAIDNRGVGGSSLPAGDLSIAMMAADAAGVLDAVDVKTARVIGFSMGGAIAQELALIRPETVSSLVLVGTWCRPDLAMKRLFDSWSWMAEHAPSDRAFLNSLYLWVYSRRAHADGSVDRWVTQALEDPHPQPLTAFQRTAAILAGHDTADRLTHLRVPALVVVGEDDLICPPEFSHELVVRPSFRW